MVLVGLVLQVVKELGHESVLVSVYIGAVADGLEAAGVLLCAVLIQYGRRLRLGGLSLSLFLTGALCPIGDVAFVAQPVGGSLPALQGRHIPTFCLIEPLLILALVSLGTGDPRSRVVLPDLGVGVIGFLGGLVGGL